MIDKTIILVLTIFLLLGTLYAEDTEVNLSETSTTDSLNQNSITDNLLPSNSPTPEPLNLENINFQIALSDNLKDLIIPDSYFTDELNKAKKLIYNNSFDSANKIISDEINKKSHSPYKKAHILAGIQSYIQGEFEKSLQSYDSYLAYNGANSDILYLKAISLLKLKKHEQAKISLEEALWFNRFTFLKPSLVELQLALYFLDISQDTKAKEYFDKVLAKDADDFFTIRKLAEIDLKSKNKVDALVNLRKLISKNGKDNKVNLMLAEALLLNINREYDKKDILEAITTLDKVLNSENDKSTIFIAKKLLIKAYIEKEELSTARKLAEDLLEINKDDEELNKLLKQISIEEASSIRGS